MSTVERTKTVEGNEADYQKGPAAKRLIVPNQYDQSKWHTEPQEEYPTNLVKSSRFTWYNFVPLALAIQFMKLPNIFWLFNGILQLIPTIRTNSPLSIFIPLAFIISVGMTKEFLADNKRKKQDKKVNAITVKKANIGSKHNNHEENKTVNIGTTNIRTDELKVGDLIIIDDDGFVPADCCLIASAQVAGEAFIMTGQLDGERNFKPKMAVKEIQSSFDDQLNQKDSGASFGIECDQPDKNLYNFVSKVLVKGSGASNTTVQTDGNMLGDLKLNMDLKQFLPRGAFVKNSGQILALVLYTGVETKILLNAGKYQYKTSSTEKLVNKISMIQIGFMVLIAVIMTIGNYVFNEANREYLEYALQGADGNGALAGLVFFSNWLLLIRYVPMDLIVNLELSKIFVSSFIENDGTMIRIDEEFNEIVTTRVQSLQLIEELGQIEYIFCDKTGTLTKNELEFRAISVNGKLYQGQENTICEDLKADEQDVRYQNFFKCIALNHDVITITNPKGEKVYSGSSQDELVLLEMAKKTKYSSFREKDTATISVQEGGPEGPIIQYKPLKFFDFTSDRKMMTMIVRDMNGKTYAFIKGADTSVVPRCENNLSDKDRETVDHIGMLAGKGLRTLCFAMKEMRGDEDWDTIKVEDVESDLTLLGCTAVEDLLQNEVDKCISDFKKANCNVWMLTGDKGETAQQIGLSTGLLSKEVKAIWLTEDLLKKRAVTVKTGQIIDDKEDIELLIDGTIMARIISSDNTRDLALPLLLKAKGVVIYRASPAQKAQLVSFIRKNCANKTTLAIGDGANDVNMIQSAHVGVGIMGKEGNQASSFADFAISEYRDLRRLMFWHGRSFGARFTDYISWIISKTAVTSTCKILWNFYTGYSGNQYVGNLAFAMFSVNVTFYAFWNIFEQDVSFAKYGSPGDESKLPFQMSALYAHCRDNEIKNLMKKYTLQMVNMIYASLVIFYIPWVSLSGLVGEDGQTYDLWTIGVVTYICTVAFCHSLFYTYTRCYNWVMFAFMIGTFLQLPIVIYLQARGMASPFYKINQQLLPRRMFWVVTLFTILVACLPNMLRKYTRMLIQYPQFTCK